MHLIIFIHQSMNEYVHNINNDRISTGFGNFMGNKGGIGVSLDVGEKKVEVKGGFITMGPPTFGPRETWDEIYFVDCQDTLKKTFKIYAIELSNTSEEWKQLKVSKAQTYYDQCLEGRRPRLTFDSIQTQLGDHCRLVFDGHFDELK